MAAVIKAWFPGFGASGQARRGGPVSDTAASDHPLIDELREKTLAVFSEALRQLFDHADDLLFEMGERADSDAERRRNFDTMRVLRLERDRVTQTFVERFREGFGASGAGMPTETPDESGFDTLSLQATEELEEKIAIGNMASKAEGLHKNAIYEVETRLEAATRDQVLALSPQSLNPGRICNAFGVAIGQIETDFHIKLVVYKLLDRVVSQEFGKVYQVALEVLEQHGIRALRKSVTTTSELEAGGDPRLKIRRPPGEPSISAAADQVLRKHGLNADDGMTITPIAAELGGLITRLSMHSGWTGLQASTQRLSMAGRLVDEMLAEPLLPEMLRPSIEGLRHAVYRSALTDPAFFVDEQHPLRRLLSELLESAVDARAGHPDSAAPQARLRKRLLDAAAFVSADQTTSTDAAVPQAISPLEVQTFLRQLREQTRLRREGVLAKVREQVAQELDTRTRGRDIPAPVMSLLRGGVGPLMAMRLLRNGRESVPFHQAQATLEGVLKSLDFMPPASRAVLQSRETLMSSIVTSLSDIGMKADRVESLLEGMREVYLLLEARAPERVAAIAGDAPDTPLFQGPDTRIEEEENSTPLTRIAAPITDAPVDSLPAVTVMELLSRVLKAETWYRVFDADHDQTRWLKLESFYPHQDSIVFSGFDETKHLNLHATRFASDLALGHSEPINPDALAKESLEQLRLAKTRGIF